MRNTLDEGPTAPSPEKAGNNRLKSILKLLLTVILVGAIIYVLDTEKLYNATVKIDARWLLIGIVLSAVFVVLRITKWIVLTAGNGLHAPIHELFRTMLLSLAVGVITPARIGEVVAVAPFGKANRAKAVMTFLYDRVGELCMVLLFCAPAAAYFLGSLGIIAALCIFAGCALAITLMEMKGLRVWFVNVTRISRINFINNMANADIGAPLMYWLVCMAAYVVAYALVASFIAGGEPIRDLWALALLPVVTLSNLISITIGGLGVREGLAAALAPLGSISPEQAAIAFFLSFFFTRVVAGLIGLIWTAMIQFGGHDKRLSR